MLGARSGTVHGLFGLGRALGDKHPLSKGLFDERLQKLGRKQDRVRPDGGRDAKQIRVWLGHSIQDRGRRLAHAPCDGVTACDSES